MRRLVLACQLRSLQQTRFTNFSFIILSTFSQQNGRIQAPSCNPRGEYFVMYRDGFYYWWNNKLKKSYLIRQYTDANIHRVDFFILYETTSLWQENFFFERSAASIFRRSIVYFDCSDNLYDCTSHPRISFGERFLSLRLFHIYRSIRTSIPKRFIVVRRNYLS